MRWPVARDPKTGCHVIQQPDGYRLVYFMEEPDPDERAQAQAVFGRRSYVSAISLLDLFLAVYEDETKTHEYQRALVRRLMGERAFAEAMEGLTRFKADHAAGVV